MINELRNLSTFWGELYTIPIKGKGNNQTQLCKENHSKQKVFFEGE